MLRGIAIEDVASTLGYFDYFKKPPTRESMIESLCFRFEVPDNYVERRLNDFLEAGWIVIKNGIIELAEQ